MAIKAKRRSLEPSAREGGDPIKILLLLRDPRLRGDHIFYFAQWSLLAAFVDQIFRKAASHRGIVTIDMR